MSDEDRLRAAADRLDRSAGYGWLESGLPAAAALLRAIANAGPLVVTASHGTYRSGVPWEVLTAALALAGAVQEERPPPRSACCGHPIGRHAAHDGHCIDCDCRQHVAGS